MDDLRQRLHQVLDVAPPSPELRARIMEALPARVPADRRRWIGPGVAVGLTLFAVTISGVLLASLKAVPQVTSVTPAPTPAPPPPQALGIAMGPISLHDTPERILQVLGEPKVRTFAHGMGSPQWEYGNGLTIILAPNAWQIVAQPPFAGATAEGFRLGDSQAAFFKTYERFLILGAESQLYVTDDSGIRLTVFLDANQTATSLILTNTRAFVTSPVPSSGVRPPARSDAAAASDLAHNQVLLFGGMGATCCLGDTWAWDAVTGWRDLKPATAPTPRRAASMAYDWSRQTVVLFGGGNAIANAETWTWDGTTWKQQQPAVSPPAREGATMAYDSNTQSLVLFGGVGTCCDTAGRQFPGRTQLGDTWLWDGVTWKPASPKTSPSARVHASMTFDPLAKAVVLFGGYDGEFLPDTWLWDGRNWIEARPESSPSPRSGAGMVAMKSPGRTGGNTVLFGGWNSAGALQDTWVWDGTTWRRALGSGPPGRHLAAMAEINEKRVVLFGGAPGAGQPPLGDLWSWDGTSWISGR
jgi:hypothetical protein